MAARLNLLEEKIETEFIRRESRTIPAVVNFISHFRPLARAVDGKSTAALTALAWRLFSPASAAAAGGILVLLLTAGQAVLIYQQNQKLDQQTFLAEASRRGALTAEIATLAETIGEERRQASAAGSIKLVLVPRGSTQSFQLKDATLSRLAAVTRQARPYRYLDLESKPPEGRVSLPTRVAAWIGSLVDSSGITNGPTPTLIVRPLSPERGLILSFLLSNNVDLSRGYQTRLDFSNADLRGEAILNSRFSAVLEGADLTKGALRGVDVGVSYFGGAVLRESCWVLVDASKANLSQADLGGATIQGVILPPARRMKSVVIDDRTSLSGSYTDDPQFLERLAVDAPASTKAALSKYRLAPLEGTAKELFSVLTTDGDAARFFVLATDRREARAEACALVDLE